jgi:hypothetical protein
MRRTLVLLSTSLALLVLWFAISAHAQSSSSATINGRVTDPSGAVVPGVTVSVRNLDTGIEQSTKTTSDGLYRLVNLTPGNYRVQVAPSSSFARAEANNVHVDVGSNRDVNFRLAVGWHIHVGRGDC